MSGPRTVSRRLAEHASGVRFAQLPAAAVRAAKWSLLDLIGVCLAASRSGEGCGAFAAVALAGGAGPAPLIGRRAGVSALAAALANGALAHALDFEDAYDAAPVHPTAAAVPALLALAAGRRGTTGTDMLTALATGTDLACRLALALEESPESRGWYPPPLFSAQGAATACAHLLGLTADRFIDAWSLTLCSCNCSSEFKRTPDSTLRAVREGLAARAGLESALLAGAGARGFDEPFEGRAGLYALYAGGQYHEGRLLDGLGRDFEGARVSYKLYPSCRGTHPYIEAGLRLHRSGIAAEQIDEVILYGHPLMRMLFEPEAHKRSPANAIDAKFSAPYCFAHALIHGALTLDSFDPASLRAPAALALAARVRFVPMDGLPLHAMSGGRTEIRLRDGGDWSCSIEHLRGSPADPLSESELIDKFRDCAARAREPLPDSAVSRLIDVVLRLEDVTDLEGTLFDALRGGMNAA